MALAAPKPEVIEALERRLCQTSLISFIQAVAPWFVIEEIHLQLAEELEAVERGEVDRLMIFMAPRAGKSATIARLFPAWYVGKRPTDQILQATHTAELSVDHGRAVRDLIGDSAYQRIFPGVTLRTDVQAAGHWMIEHAIKGAKQGEYYAAGVGGRIAGRGWNLGIIDDPLSEQDTSELARARVRKWFGPGFYTRRQPERNAAIIMTTRWAADDLPGYLLDMQANDPSADKWRVVEVPAILTDEAAARLNRYSEAGAFYDAVRARVAGKTSVVASPVAYAKGDSFAPRRWPRAEVERAKATMTNRDWSAIYLQKPTTEEGNIMKRADWRPWKSSKPPECYEVLAFYDTAFEEEESSDPSARTTWGLFDFNGLTNVMLLEVWEDKIGEPKPLLDEMERHAKEYEVDAIYVEKRATGSWLVKEARRRRLPARAWLPPSGLLRGARNKGKTPRAKLASFVLESGAVWYMPGRKWVEKVIDQCADVPFGDKNDIADTVTMCLIEVRQRWKIEIKGIDDREEKEDDDFDPRVERFRVYG